MAEVVGTVSNITVGSTYCCVTINKTGGGSETVLLWSYGAAQPDNANNRLLHANYLALTRDAYIHGKTLRVGHPTSSALVDLVVIST